MVPWLNTQPKKQKQLFPHKGLTSKQDTTKDCVVTVQCAAVPSMVPKLVLALSDPLFGAFTDGLHDVRVALAELPLFVHQARDVIADYSSSQSTDVPKGARNKESLIVFFVSFKSIQTHKVAMIGD